MKLIVLAHYGEAQSIIDHFSLSKKSEELYQNSEISLLLTGEGPFEAATAVSAHLASGFYSQVINLGITGSLDEEIKVGEICEVRTIYLVVDGKLQYKSFNLGHGQKDLITSFERVLNLERAHALKGFGQLVDREAWGVAFACKEHGVPLRSFKLISDVAGTLGACESVKESAQSFSLKLLRKLQEILDMREVSPEEKNFTDENFYFTFSLRHKFQNLLKMITLRDELTIEEVMKKIDLTVLKEQKITPKMRAKLLVDELEVLLDPFKGKLQIALNDWKKQYPGIDIITDSQWENEAVKFVFEASGEQELQQKIKILQQVDLATFQQFLQGQIDVE